MSDVYTDDQILAARHELWRQGVLEWKLSPPQKRMYEFWKDSEGKTTVFNCGRRVGKTYFLTVVALELCINKAGATVKFLQPEKGQIQTNVMPVMEEILLDCPADVRPVFKTQQSAYVFPNGSKIQLRGTDSGSHEKLRGDNAHLCLIDEAAFLKAPLTYIIRSILAPATLRTFGKIILSSSTPVDPDHDFLKYMATAESKNNCFKVTTMDALHEHEKVNDDRLTRQMLDTLIEEYPLGVNDPEFKRECLNELLIDGSKAIIPEFTDDIMSDIVTEWRRPPFCDKYVSMDIGFKDLTFVIFGYYDFLNGMTVIEDELIINGPEMTTDKLAEAIMQKEHSLWTDPLTNEFDEPHMRVCDNNLILINDLRRLHGLNFIPTKKDNKEAQINNLRMEVSQMQLVINPRCEQLIKHLKYGTWDKSRQSFSRSPDSGHFDGIDALVYLIRNINKSHNPYPPGYNVGFLGNASDIFVRPGHAPDNNDHSDFLKLFKTKK